jgi:hypothetical protein
MESGDEMHTSRLIDGKLKGFLDNELLEGKCPDHYSDVRAFDALTAAILVGPLAP